MISTNFAARNADLLSKMSQALPGLDLEPLARFEGAEMMRGYFGEDIALYRLSRRPGS